MSRAEMSMETMVKVIIGLIVLVIVIWGFSAGYKKITSLGGLEWDDLSLSEQGKIIYNFDKTVSLLNSCSKFNCLCGSEKGFPFSFRDEEKIIINNTAKRKSDLILMHKDTEVNRASLNTNIFLNTVPLNIYPMIYTISFDSNQYSVDGKDGKSDKQAFAKIGDSLYLFNSKASEKSDPAYKAYLGFNSTC